MKKFCLFILSLFLLFNFSCNNQQEDNDFNQSKMGTNSMIVNDVNNLADSSLNSEDFFSLDYRPLVPENQKEYKKVNTNFYTQNSSETQEYKAKKISLDKYTINYYPDSSKIVTTTEKTPTELLQKDESTKFEIIEYGPKDFLPSEITQPSFYVIFSKPVHPLMSLEKKSSSSDFMKIEPPLKGSFRWYSSNHLAFESEENIIPLQEYKIIVPQNIKSLDGSILDEEFSFTTKTEGLEIIDITCGYKYQKEHNVFFRLDDLPLEAAQELRIKFNFPITKDEIKNQLKIVSNQEEIFDYSIMPVDSKTYDIFLTTKPKFESTLFLRINDITQKKISTLKKFKLNNSSTNYSYSKYSNPVSFYFSHPIDESSVLQNIYCSLNTQITKDNIEVFSSVIKVFNLPVSYNESYKIIFKEGLKDIYGRYLGEAITKNIRVPAPKPQFIIKDVGVKILESQFPHKIIFEHQNLLSDSYYEVSKTDSPLYPWKYEWNPNSENLVKIDNSIKDTRIFEEVNFDQYLNKGFGGIIFKSLAKIPSESNPQGYWENKSSLSVQVTDLGATVRYGINKAVVLVTSLSSGKEVKNAEVYIYNAKKFSTEDILRDKNLALSFAKTNDEGLAIMKPQNPNDFENFDTYNDDYELAFLVSKGNDKVTFFADNHSAWRQGIYPSSIKEAYNDFQRTFLFTDRGLYKPGETLTFKGIDKTQQLGTLSSYNGNYTITLEEQIWRNPQIFASINNATSSSGGFSGSITLPEDIKPGIYNLSYQREGSKEKQSISINVAFFERLKFQCEIQMPQMPIICGEDIQSTLTASYLAGGNLSNANYDANWFKETWYFSSDNPELKNLKFGPISSEGNRNYLSNEKGTLANGKVKLNCKTSAEGIKGLPYRYRVSSNIVDISNQMINTSNAIIVHPASFYIGVSKAEGISGFAKANTDLSFSYALSDLYGNPLKEYNNKEPAIIELIREEWKSVQQQGVNGTIYSRYVKENIVENTQKISLSPKGKISVTPQKAGHYILKISSKDSKDRTVITEQSFYVTGSSTSYWNRDDEHELKLTTNQSVYNPGDTAQILLESPLSKGKYLITVEREGIFTEDIINIEENTKVIKIPIARNFIPVVYVSVSSYSVRTKEPSHNYGEVDLDKPKGYYGATTLFVNPRVKSFSVDVQADKPSYKPGEEVTITLTATKNGYPLQNAELTFMAVDRGVLDLINYHVPDPIKFFYDSHNYPLRVRGGDSRAYLMDPVVYQTKNLQGGDSDEDKIEQRKDFNPTAVFCPTLITDKNGKVTTKFILPDNLTTYRLTAFGVQQDCFALQEQELLVQNPINVQPILPRRLRERDTAEVGILLTNLSNKDQNITIDFNIQKLEESNETSKEVLEQKKNTEPDQDTLEKTSIQEVPEQKEITKGDSLSGFKTLSGDAFVEGTSSKTISLKSGQSATVYFYLGALSQGTVNSIFTISSDILNEKIINPIIIEKPYLFETVTSTGIVHDNQEQKDEGIIFPNFSQDNKGSFTINVDASKLGTLKEAINFVFDYPYGCLEQQTSKMLPLIIFEDYLSIFDLDNKITNTKTVIKNFFEYLSGLQLNNGGFAYWPENSKSDLYVSMRISHLYALALQNGYNKNDLKLDIEKLNNYIHTTIIEESHSDFLTAHAYYILSLYNINTNRNVLKKIVKKPNLNLGTLSLVGLADDVLAAECFDRVRSFLRPTTRGIDITYPYNAYDYNFFCNFESYELALVLKFLLKSNPQNILVSKTLFTLLEKQKNGYWNNTSTTAAVLDSIATFIKKTNMEQTDFNAIVKLDNTELIKKHFNGIDKTLISKQYSFNDKTILNLQKNKLLPLCFIKEGTGTLYYTASLKYSLPQEIQDARDEGIGLSLIIRDAITNEEIQKDSQYNILKLEKGKTYKAQIHISSTHDRNYLALRTPIPSGAEILDTTFVTTAQIPQYNYNQDDKDYWNWYKKYFSGHWMSNQQIYDNEVRTFWNYFAKGTTSVTFMFRTKSSGIYPTPPVYAECMYESEIFGRSNGILYEIE